MKSSFKRITFLFLQAFLAVAFLVSSLSAKAWVSHDEAMKPYNFKFKFENQVFEYKQKSASYEEAFSRAAQACYTHFKAGRHLSEDRGLDIIDVCANPRS